MKSLPEERNRRLAEKSGWSMPRAEGFLEGEMARMRSEKPSSFALVGTTDHAKGYRDGYFGRHSGNFGLLNPEMADGARVA